MATIQTSIQLYDGMSSILENITTALDSTISEFETLQNATEKDFNANALRGARESLNDANAELIRMQENFSSVNDEIRTGESHAGNFASKIGSVLAAYLSLQTAKKAIDLSDTYANTTARLNMMNDGLQTTSELQDKIFASAQRSRGEYQATADTVSKLGLMAGDAFNSNDEIINFMEQINKQFTIAGTDNTRREAALLQLTQAMGSGVLRGEEYNSVLEQAPNIIQAIADYMDVPKGKLKDMAADGKITADIVKNAMFAAADETNEKFESMPKTFSQIWTSFENYALMAFNPVFQRLNDIANSEQFTEFVNGAINAFAKLADTVLWLFDIALQVGEFISSILNVFEPSLRGIAAGLAVIAAYWLIVEAATKIATTAQAIFNAIADMNPIVLTVAAVIAIIYALVSAINKATGSTISATGVILGVISVLGAGIWNIVIGLINAIIQLIYSVFVERFISIIEWILNVANGGFNSFGDAVKNLIGQIISWFLSLGKVVTKIIDAIFGTDWTAGLNQLQENVLSWGKNENAITLSHEAPTIGNRIEYSTAWNNAYNFGADIADKVGGIFDGDESLSNFDKISDSCAVTADNTGKISDKLTTLTSDVDAIRSWAEKEAINKFTTASVSITMQNENKISSYMDVDGVVNRFVEGIREGVQMTAEGAYD